MMVPSEISATTHHLKPRIFPTLPPRSSARFGGVVPTDALLSSRNPRVSKWKSRRGLDCSRWRTPGKTKALLWVANVVLDWRRWASRVSASSINVLIIAHRGGTPQ